MGGPPAIERILFRDIFEYLIVIAAVMTDTVMMITNTMMIMMTMTTTTTTIHALIIALLKISELFKFTNGISSIRFEMASVL